MAEMTGVPGVDAQAIKMLSIEKCKQILTKGGANYTDEEVKRIRELLYQLGHLDYLLYNQNSLKDGERNHLHKSLNRRAS